MSMNGATRLRALGLTFGAVLLSACGSSESVSLETPTFFSYNVDNGILTGKYNPAGFDAAEVKSLISSGCRGGSLVSYEQTPEPDGLVSFKGRCAGGSIVPTGIVEVEKPS